MKKSRNPESDAQNLTIFPVILQVPEAVREFKPKDRVVFLSRHARSALEKSAEKSGLRLGKLVKDDNGAPLPVDGVYWSITHKTDFVGGVVAPAVIGIDIEKIRSCSQGVYLKTAAEQEYSMARAQEDYLTTFFRFWTAKEAVVKACGTGIKDLRKCRVRKVPDDDHLEISYQEKKWVIEHFFFDGHIASIVKNGFKIEWTIVA